MGHLKYHIEVNQIKYYSLVPNVTYVGFVWQVFGLLSPSRCIAMRGICVFY